MLYQVQSYLKFLLKSTNQHGVHSPFVYEFLTQCAYKKTTIPPLFKVQRNQLLEDVNTIQISDYGAGSKIFKNNTRRIKDLAKYAGISKQRQALLYKVVAYFNPHEMLELGTSLGMATTALSLGNPEGNITTVEGCSNIAEKATANFTTSKLKNIRLIQSTFDHFFTSKTNQNKYDLVFIDGNHSKKSTLTYFESVLPHIHKNSILIFDDIYWNKGMTEAWNLIKEDPKVRVSIDSFYWGLLFFRTEQEKQHFTLRL